MVDLTDENKWQEILSKKPKNKPVYYNRLEKDRMIADIRREYFTEPELLRRQESLMKEQAAEESRELLVETEVVKEVGVTRKELPEWSRRFQEFITSGKEKFKEEGFPLKFTTAYAKALADLAARRGECVSCIEELNKAVWEEYDRVESAVGRKLTQGELDKIRELTVDFTKKLKDVGEVI